MGKDDKTTERSGSSNTQTSENTQKDKAEVMRKRQNHHSNSIKRAFGKITSDTSNDASNFELEDMLTTLDSDWTEYKAEYAKNFDEDIDDQTQKAFEKHFIEIEGKYLKTTYRQYLGSFLW